MKKHTMWSGLKKIIQCLLNYKLVRNWTGQLTVTESTKDLAFKIDQLLLNGLENSVTLIGKPNTIYYIKVARTKDNGTWSQRSELQRNEVFFFWNDRPLLQIKSNHFWYDDWYCWRRIYKIDIQKKLSTRTIDHFTQEEQQTMFAIANFVQDRQTGLLSKD
jgi:hypothetical protein